MMKYFLICILLLKICNSNIYSQNIDNQINDSVNFSENVYLLSIEKQLFLSSDTTKINELLLLKAQFYKKINKYEKAIKTLKRIDVENIDDTTKRLIYYEIALNSYAMNRNEDCIFYASRLLKLQSNNDTLEKMSYLLLALTYNERIEYDKAQIFSKKYIKSECNNDSIINVIDSLYLYNPNNISLNPDKSALLSTIIPGLGHVYSGKIFEGFGQFATTMGLLSLIIYTLSVSNYATAILLQSSIFIKFYTGGIRRSRYLANQRNYKSQKAFNFQIKKLLLESCK